MDRARKAIAGLLVVAILIQGCSAVSLVPVSPRADESLDRLTEDQKECETTARAQSGYSAWSEAGAWLLIILGVAAIGAGAYSLSRGDVTPYYDWSWDGSSSESVKLRHADYLRAYKSCMEARGYQSEAPPGPSPLQGNGPSREGVR